MHVRDMISTHPHVQRQTNDALPACIEACYDCAQTCTSCADACLGEENHNMLIQCIRRNLDCADICAATGAIASRRTGSNTEVMRAVIQACAEACRVCGEECRSHAEMHEHCRICGEACLRCEEACRAAIAQFG
jgi:hypothetical protein